MVGSALLFVAAAKDGSTLFWAADPRDGAPLAKRWGGCEGPWRLQLPLEGVSEQSLPTPPPQQNQSTNQAAGGSQEDDGLQGVAVPNIPVSASPEGVRLCLTLSADPWAYRGGLPSAMVRTQGPRSVVLQVLEGRMFVMLDPQLACSSTATAHFKRSLPSHEGCQGIQARVANCITPSLFCQKLGGISRIMLV